MNQSIYERTFGPHYREAWASMGICQYFTEHIQRFCGWLTHYDFQQAISTQPRQPYWNFAHATIRINPHTEIKVVCEPGDFEGIIDVFMTGNIHGVTTSMNVYSYAVRDKSMIERAKRDLCQIIPVFGYKLLAVEQEISIQDQTDE